MQVTKKQYKTPVKPFCIDSQFDMIWITDGIMDKKIKKKDISKYLSSSS